jgi:PAS domain S-box-containing protein
MHSNLTSDPMNVPGAADAPAVAIPRRLTAPARRRGRLLIALFTVTVSSLLVLAVFCMDVLSAARAYVGGESLWSKAQKDGVRYLMRYAESHDDNDWRRYQQAISIPLGDRVAREELEKPQPDLAAARGGFLDGGIHPDDIPRIIRLFRWFRHVRFLDRAIGIWAEGDRLVAELNEVAEQLQAMVVAGSDPSAVRPLLTRIEQLDQRLTPLEVRFSETLGEASRQTQTLLTIAVTAIGALLIAFAALFVRRVAHDASRYEHAIRESEGRYERALLGCGDGIWDWDLTTNEVYVSPRFEAMLGYEQGSLPRTVQALKALVHPDDRAHARGAASTHLQRKAPYDVELRLRTCQGNWRWFRSRAQLATDPLGRTLRVAGTIIDVTERRLAQEALREANEQLEQRVAERTRELTDANARLVQLDRLKSEFLATMSHELRTPLNAILGLSGLLRDERSGPLNDEQKRQLGLIKNSGRRLLEMIDDVLHVSGIEAGYIDLQPVQFDFAQLLTQLGAIMQPIAKAKQLAFVCQARSTELPVYADRSKCLRVLRNLADNALKFTDAGEVRITAGFDGSDLVVTVSDTGIGIAAEQLPAIFEAFRQLDGSSRRAYGGIGLGLYLCRKLLDMMGGRIDVESVPGAGSLFSVRLPAGSAVQ